MAKTYTIKITKKKDLSVIKKLLRDAGLIEVSPDNFIEKPKITKEKTTPSKTKKKVVDPSKKH